MQTPRENFISFLRGEEYSWIPCSADMLTFAPALIPDNIARGRVAQQKPYTGSLGGRDMLGVEWYYDAANHGSMEVAPLMDDIEDWPDIVKFPDFSAFDWEGCAKENAELLNTDELKHTIIYTGFFERLIAFVGFENAAMALVDEDQLESVHELFDRLADMHIEFARHMHRYFGVELIELHDDWGTQTSTMFSRATYDELIAPYIKRIADTLHAEGMLYYQHSCGCIGDFIPALIETGADTWTGQDNANDKPALVEKHPGFGFGVRLPVCGEGIEAAVRAADEGAERWQGKRVWFFLGVGFSPEQKAAIARRLREIGLKKA